MLEVTGLQKKYKEKTVFENVTLQMKPGEIVGLVGENGAGKSTLLELLATVMQPTLGEIELEGFSYTDGFKTIRRLIGYVPQDIAVWEEFTVEENMQFFEKLSWKKHTKEECRQLCVDMQLTQWKEEVRSLSGGMKRKLNLAISLLNDPVLLLLDEPTVGIDLKSKIEIGSYLHNLAKSDGKMIMYTSHDMDEITTLCDRVYSIGKDPFYMDLLTKNEIAVEQLK
ncbi:ABC transporter ATP-binding protein [Sporosarcina sp. JAI121]|uniref:ABC transporter ATP-binding protein n=1 Tax=Sporosarcina sp. JAI121 TaxID=2723064 RepID=UPI0015C72A02|nr:ABC transporter ATP-binding protein [Sporosarcina sp. JAI121]NYF25339.1 ABC-2 type transport system ATP-binding protein [Sporosarcina sp. JAI121]